MKSFCIYLFEFKLIILYSFLLWFWIQKYTSVKFKIVINQLLYILSFFNFYWNEQIIILLSLKSVININNFHIYIFNHYKNINITNHVANDWPSLLNMSFDNIYASLSGNGLSFSRISWFYLCFYWKMSRSSFTIR